MTKAVNKTKTLRVKGKISDKENTHEIQESNINADAENTKDNDDTMAPPACCCFIPMVNRKNRNRYKSSTDTRS